MEVQQYSTLNTGMHSKYETEIVFFFVFFFWGGGGVLSSQPPLD